MKKKSLLIVDDNSGFFKRFQNKLEVDDIDDEYQLFLLEPDTVADPHEMAEKVVDEAKRYASDENVCGIFVDIVIREGATLDAYGILIAEKLRTALPMMPIYSITTAQQTHMDHLGDASLGDCDGVFPKSYLEGDTFSAKRLKRLLKRGAEKRQKLTAGIHSSRATKGEAIIPISPSISKSFNLQSLESRVAAQIEELGAGAFWGLIQKLIPHASGVISYVAPGASGAYVFNANVKFNEPDVSATVAKQFLIKVSTSFDGMQIEAHNRRDLVKAQVSREHFPDLLNEEPTCFEGLSGIAYEFETGHETFLTFLVRELQSDKPHPSIGPKLISILKGIYGDSIKEVKNVWHDCYPLKKTVLIRMLGYISENRPTLVGLVTNDKILCVENFLSNSGEKLRSLSKEIDTRYIHGDFNCGNILIDGSCEDDIKISIIDLGSRGQDHIIKDVAKLERDIVFRIFDWDTEQYHDPNRISVWRQFLLMLELGAIFKPIPAGVIEDKGVLAAAQIITELRSGINTIDLNGDETNYRVALLHYSLLALLHPRISTAKKAFAIEYASAIINLLP